MRWGPSVLHHMPTCIWGGWERDIFFPRDDLAPLLDNVVCWYRYINDVLVFWSGSEIQLQQVMQIITINHFNLKFTVNYSQTDINFLDLNISIDGQGLVHSFLYRKPSAGNMILHASSSHPEPLVESIPYSQYLRLRRNCSRDSDFQSTSKDLYYRLQSRGYSHKCLKHAYNRVKVQKISALIFTSKHKSKADTVRLIAKYSNQHKKMRNI